MEPSSTDKLIRGIWEQIHGSLSFDLRHMVSISASVAGVSTHLFLLDQQQVNGLRLIGKRSETPTPGEIMISPAAFIPEDESILPENDSGQQILQSA